MPAADLRVLAAEFRKAAQRHPVTGKAAEQKTTAYAVVIPTGDLKQTPGFPPVPLSPAHTEQWLNCPHLETENLAIQSGAPQGIEVPQKREGA